MPELDFVDVTLFYQQRCAGPDLVWPATPDSP
jgi:hypothetical protein